METTKNRKRNLLENKFLKRLILSRNIQPLAQLINFILFILVIITGIIGVSLGAKNLSVVFTWIVWSVLLALVLTPFLGRIWCFMCPIVWPGEIIQRKLWGRFGTSIILDKHWPKSLSNVWLQNFVFIAFASLMVVLITRPLPTSIVVITLIIVATILFIIFPRRRFCRHVCPPSLFIGLYAQFSPLEVRVKDREICHIPASDGGCHKECFVGSEKGYGCPWYEFPQNMVSNADCGLCTECFKTCPKDNIALNIRPFDAELKSKEVHRKPDEAWRSLILLALPVVYSAVLFGPWSWLKNWGDLLLYSTSVGIIQHIFYVIMIVDIVLGVFPGLHLLASYGSKLLTGVKEVSTRNIFVSYAYAYIPLGLMLWMGFNFSLIMMEWSYIPVVASDPFGAGWNLLGTTFLPWIPLALPIPIAEVAFASIGVVLSLSLGYFELKQIFQNKKDAIKALIPFMILTVMIASFYLWFYV
ncbi:MAG TPA: hypothetical protein VIH27_07665 [Nitrososphaerales archaeon]